MARTKSAEAAVQEKSGTEVNSSTEAKENGAVGGNKAKKGKETSTYTVEEFVKAADSVFGNYSIANPTASISFGGGGTGSATVTASLNAAGGEVGRNGPELSWVGEEGLEYIIPTVPGRRSRGIELWKAAGRTLGVLDSDGNISAHAAGGMVGSGFGFTPEDAGQITWEPENEDDTVWSVMGRSSKGDSSKESSEGEGTTVSVEAPKNSQGEGGNTFTINVDMSPVFRIDGEGMDDDRIMEVVQSRIRAHRLGRALTAWSSSG